MLAFPDLKACLGVTVDRVFGVPQVYLVGKGKSALKGILVLEEFPVVEEALVSKDILVLEECVVGQVWLVVQACPEGAGWMEQQEHKANVGCEGREVDKVRKEHRVREGHRVITETGAIEDRRAEEDRQAREDHRVTWDHRVGEGHRAGAGRAGPVSHGARGGTTRSSTSISLGNNTVILLLG